ncbi:MAG: cytochrome c oxidase assembly protein subunit 11 [Psychromonas sp.]|jgi:cytochrome c oxidase assembly protein subunit 11
MSKHTKLFKKLVIASIGMFAFAFALVPLYDVFCDITGLNGKPSLERAETSTVVDLDRQVDVGFLTHVQNEAPFKVTVDQALVTVKPGEMNQVTFSAHNLSNESRTMQAVPSISPGLAAQYMHKVECFCFTQQILQPGEKVSLTLLFYIDTEITPNIKELTLSYTVFDIVTAN